MAAKLDSVARLSGTKILMVGVGLTALYYFAVFPDMAAIETSTAAIQQTLNEEKQKQNVTLKAQKRQEELRQELADLSSRFAETSNRLPTEVNSSILNKQINDIAKISGGALKEIAPRTPVMKDFIEQIPVEVGITGTYGEIVLFLYHLSTSERIAKIGTFEMLGTGVPSRTKDRGTLINFRGSILSFRFVPEAVKSTEAEAGQK